MVIWSSVAFGLIFLWLIIHYVIPQGFMMWLVWSLTLFVGIGVGLLASGAYKINFTNSAPQGLYRLVAISPGTNLLRDDLVVITPDFLPQEYRERYLPIQVPIMKRIVGLSGDRISLLTGRYLALNGLSLGLSSIVQKTDSDGRPMSHPTYPVIVPPNNVWIMSDNTLGYDSRYFGSVPLKAVLQRAFPVFTW